MPVQPGDLVEFAIWLSGEETEAQLHHFKTVLIKEMIDNTERENNIKLSVPKFIMKKPGEDRVPTPPDHIKGIDVRLMVVEATARKGEPQPRTGVLRDGSFLTELRENDLKVLRQITRSAYRKQHGQPLTNKQCDTIIDYLGPNAAVAALRKASH